MFYFHVVCADVSMCIYFRPFSFPASEVLDQDKLHNTVDETTHCHSADLGSRVVSDNHFCSSSYSALSHSSAGAKQWHRDAPSTDDIQTRHELDHLNEYGDNSQHQEIAIGRDVQMNQAHQPLQRTKKMRLELALVTTSHAKDDIPNGASGHSTGSKRTSNSASFINNKSENKQKTKNLKLKQKRMFAIDINSDNESDTSDEFTGRKSSVSIKKRLHKTKIPSTEENDDDTEEEDERLSCTLLTLEEILSGRQSHGM